MGAQGSHNFNIIPPIPEGTALLIFLVHSNLKEIPRGLFFCFSFTDCNMPTRTLCFNITFIRTFTCG